MSRLLVITSAIALAAAGSVAAKAPAAQESPAKISLASAKTIALKARPGVVTDSELEKEAGGSGLRYSFDVKSHGVVYEVGVDAVTGQVLENAPEGANPD